MKYMPVILLRGSGTHRHRNRQTQSQTDRQTDRQRYTDRQADTHTPKAINVTW